ncbi:MAG: hypothetical protein H7070_16830 [Saprospiraceae bacterium]|nr:hypothetical protein [Pyrinomonadaceae bacterium]
MSLGAGKNNKNKIKAAFVLAALIVFAASCLQQAQKSDPLITADETQQPQTTRVSDGDFGTFSHSVKEHDTANCSACHRRETGSPDLQFAGHDSCVGCHMAEFTNNKTQICMVCHSDLQTVPAGMKQFPQAFKESFNMKFEHAAHISGDGLPRQGCAHCHEPAGASQTIPVRVQAHSNCFACHTPESKIGSCNTCHALGPYNRTPPTSNVIKAVFRHSDHTGRQGVDCMECHSVRASGPQSRQVTAPVAVQHSAAGGVSCRTCHNDRRAFGESNFSNCARCHRGSGFDMLPGSPQN